MAAADVLMDTSGFLALWDASDGQHHRAVLLQAELALKRRRFLTTDYIVDETVTLLLVRHSHTAAADFLQTVATSELLQLQWVSSDRFHAAAKYFARHDDKEWSFTDCVSFTLMHELSIRDCFTTNRHFRQAGFNPLLKV
jgi:predicted nucleic acid-binding protein